MSRLLRGLLLLTLGLVPMSAYAQGRIVAYFDSRGSKRVISSPGVGEFSVVFIYGEGFATEFVSGVQYVVDYGPQLALVADLGLPPVAIGTSATGLSIGFGAPRSGVKFMIHASLVEWRSDCSVLQNVDIRTGPHPQFSDPTPIATRYPDFDVIAAEAVRSQTCQIVELDVNPLVCPNTFALTAWQPQGSTHYSKDRFIAVALAGSPTVDISAINLSSLRLQGVAPRGKIHTTFDIAFADKDADCLCDYPNFARRDGRPLDLASGIEQPDQVGKFIGVEADGQKDILLLFNRHEIAAAISPTAPPEGTEVSLSLRGRYTDGMPFEATDCITIGPSGLRDNISMDEEDGSSGDDVASMGFPNPNPFNPVTRIEFSVPTTQHVRVAIYDVAGRLVQDLVNEVKARGEHVVEWDAGSLPSGIYFYRLETGGQSIVRRATLLK